MNYCVVTTINKPTKAIEELYGKFGNNLIIVGDKKTPQDWSYKTILPINEELKLYAPQNHYARKNLGYLNAIKNNAKLIYDTDDDNIPNEAWNIRSEDVVSVDAVGKGWFNAYKVFLDSNIWPRGFSLKNLKESVIVSQNKTIKNSSIQQGLADGEPDVDAIWRLAIQSEPTIFTKNVSVSMNEGAWCPFNSQSTWWFPKAFPLMYLPVNASFRMTDIWRSFIAQRCLREIGEFVVFHSPSEVYQDRNEHDLIADFKDETEGYLKNHLIVEILDSLELSKGEENVCLNLLKCYEELVNKNMLPFNELDSVKQWIQDYKNIKLN